ncbi:MAG: hypothetical protein ACLFTY_03965 [Candidatus Aenigmatarchaeota archaeon]
MEEKLLQKINNSAVEKKLRKFLNNGFSLNEKHIEEMLSRKIDSSYLQVFPTVNEEQILKNINLNLTETENLLLLVQGNPKLHWKATELVKAITEESDSRIIWKFDPSHNKDRILKIIALSY